MNVDQLKRILDLHANRQSWQEPAEVMIAIARPSVGAIAMLPIESASFGFDWEHGKFILRTKEPVVVKPKEMAAFDMAVELLIHLAIKDQVRETYEVRQAKKILEKAGYKAEDIEKLKNLLNGPSRRKSKENNT